MDAVEIAKRRDQLVRRGDVLDEILKWRLESGPISTIVFDKVRDKLETPEPTAEDIQRVYDAIEPFLGPWDPGGFQAAEAAIKAFLRTAP